MNAMREYIRAYPDGKIPANEAKSIIIRREHIDIALAKVKEFEDSKGKVGLAMYA